MSNKITVEATINADIKTVWDYWTKPEHIVKWNFASEEWHCTKAENDLTVGGKTFSRMEAKDGSFGFDFEGVYDEISEGRYLKYTLADSRVVETTFVEQKAQTNVTTVFEADKENPENLQRDGWLAILNNFKKYSEANKYNNDGKRD